MRHYITKGGDGGVFQPNGGGYNPGDELVFTGDYTYVYFNNLIGLPASPIILINEGQVELTGFSLVNCQHVKILGNGEPDIPFGFLIDQGTSVNNNSVGIDISGKSSHIEAAYFRVQNAGFGSWLKNEHFTDATLSDWVLSDVTVHDFEMENLNHHGFYYGATEQENLTRPNENGEFLNPSRLGNVKIYNGKIRNIGKNGVMLSDARYGMSEIYNMDIEGTGNQQQQDQGTGISLGGWTRAKVYNNKVNTTWLWNFATFGATYVEVIGNTLSNAGVNGGASLPWPQNIRLTGQNGVPESKFIVLNNTLSNPASGVTSVVIYAGQWGTENVYANNKTPGGAEATKEIASGIVYSGDIAPVPDPPPNPPPPVKEVFKKGCWILNRKRFYYVAYKDSTWLETNSKYVPK